MARRSSLHLRPYVSCRMHDAPLVRSDGRPQPFPLTVTTGRYEVMMPGGVPPLKLCLRPPVGVFVADDHVSASVSYRIERDRGSEHVEDLFSPGYFTAGLRAGETVALVASVESWELLTFETQVIVEAERQRLTKLLARVPASEEDDFVRQLVLAVDQFIVLPGSRPEEDVLARASGDRSADRDRRLSLVRRLGPGHDDQSRRPHDVHGPA